MNRIIFISLMIILIFLCPLIFSCRSKEPVQEEQGPLVEQEAPIQEEPYIAGVGDVTFPERIPGSYVEPVYPEKARQEKVEGNVILQVVVKKDGTVGDMTVLRSPGKDLGFEEAALEAVKQWRYKPATKNQEPVDVYLTVQVTFTLT